MTTIDSVLRDGLSGDDAELRLTLDPRFQGLPDTAHGGAVLAVFHAAARLRGPQHVRGVYRRRVPLGTSLGLTLTREDGHVACRLVDGSGALLVDGGLRAARDGVDAATSPPEGGHPLPVSSTCFACGVDNPLGLRVRLAFDDDHVWTRWMPPRSAMAGDGSLTPIALTALLDEAAFWLGALASGESGMTTELEIALHRPAPFGETIVVAGSRARVRPHDDGRFWDTEITAADASGRRVASARITFVAVRGAARRLVKGLLALNPPDVLRRVFPAYAS